MADSELIVRLGQAKQRLRAARTRTQKRVQQCQKLVSKAIVLMEKYDQLEERVSRKSGTQLRGRRAQKGSNLDAVGMLSTMKKALANVDGLVMVPQDGEAVRNLKSDLLNTVANLQFRRILGR